MGQVQETDELRRILALPKREPLPQDFADRLTEVLKTPNGTMRLRDLQAQALLDIGTCNGAFCPIGVGDGKTLISFLAARVLGAKRPLLLEPAGLIKERANDRDALARHWQIPNNVRMYSYEMLGRADHETELEIYEPDLIVADEAHRLKNDAAAVMKRVNRWMRTHPDTAFVALSGSFMDKSILEFAHILFWCLKLGAPIPLDRSQLEEWALALDEKVEDERRYEPGALYSFASPEDGEGLAAVRRGFKRRLTETPGVVASIADGEYIGASIYVRPIQYEVSKVTEAHFKKLREEYLTPDDWDVTPIDIWRHSRELALGFHQIWEPRPPDEWRDARRAWFAFVRRVLSRSQTLDSPEPVERACDAGDLDSGGTLEAWREIQPTFTPNPVPVWHDDSALQVCAKWMKKPGIVWSEHVPFARRLAKLAGVSYYSREGLDDAGRFIGDAKSGTSAVVSADANREGRNLQGIWHRNLIASPMESCTWWQQLIARTHRPGQREDEVIVDVLLGCGEHYNAMIKAIASARAVLDTTGAPQKLLSADVQWPLELPKGPRWFARPKPFEL